MQCLPEVKRLLALGTNRERVCALRLQAEQRTLQGTDAEVQALARQIDGLQQLLASSRLEGQQLSAAQLTAALRQNGVPRRQLGDLMLERARLDHAQKLQQAQLRERREQHAALQRKQHKYRHIQQRALAQQRLRSLEMDEAFLEDLLMSRP